MIEEQENWKNYKLSYFENLAIMSFKELAIEMAIKNNKLKRDDPVGEHLKNLNLFEFNNMGEIETICLHIFSQYSNDEVLKNDSKNIIRMYLKSYATEGIQGIIKTIKR
jgi:hypothetical protein